MEASPDRSAAEQRFAMRLSLAAGFLMLAGKTWAWYATGSAAVFSDAAESVVHVAAVGFAVFSLWLSLRPPDAGHRYGHEKVAFFSAGFEGAMIVLAAAVILAEAARQLVVGPEIRHIDVGLIVVAGAAAVNGLLGWFLLRRGRRHRSIILEADGKHVLTDCLTSLGVIGGLLLVRFTGWKPFDPLIAIAVAANILHSGWTLVRRSVGGLMDAGDPETEKVLRALLAAECGPDGAAYHEMRHRTSGNTTFVELHLLFPRGTPIEAAHARASGLERSIAAALPGRVEVTTHLEPIEDHDEQHRDAPAGRN